MTYAILVLLLVALAANAYFVMTVQRLRAHKREAAPVLEAMAYLECRGLSLQSLDGKWAVTDHATKIVGEISDNPMAAVASAIAVDFHWPEA